MNILLNLYLLIIKQTNELISLLILIFKIHINKIIIFLPQMIKSQKKLRLTNIFF